MLMMTSPKPAPGDDELQMLEFAEVIALVRLSENTIRKLVKEDEFPRFIKAGSRSLFRRSDVKRWLDERFRGEE